MLDHARQEENPRESQDNAVLKSARRRVLQNGFTTRSTAQVLSWILFAALIVSHSLLTLPALKERLEWPVFAVCAVLSFVPSIITSVAAFRATKCRCADPLLKSRLRDDAYRILYSKDPQNVVWCVHCQWFVSASAKHCRRCDRCCDTFEHHCVWLNNCVAFGKNYRDFVMSLASLLVMLALYGTLAAVLAPAESEKTRRVLLWVLLGVMSFIFVPSFHLLVLHAYLHARGLSTFEWIMQNKKRVAPAPEMPIDSMQPSGGDAFELGTDVENRSNSGASVSVVTQVSGVSKKNGTAYPSSPSRVHVQLRQQRIVHTDCDTDSREDSEAVRLPELRPDRDPDSVDTDDDYATGVRSLAQY
ncbi:MAG: hypothetical protein MHM6MM_005392 [Cercozoa sp. M6MM]